MAPSQYLRQRSGYGGQYRAAQNGTGYPLGTILRGCFTQAQSRHNAQVGHIVLQHNQHNGRQGHHPQQRVTKFGTGCKIRGPVSRINKTYSNQ